MPEIETFEKALGNIAALFNHYNVEYMVIGGLANAKWGRPRATLDIDITIWAQDHEIKHIIAMFQETYTLRVEKPIEFVKETRVLPIKTPEKQQIDIVFGALPFEKQAIERAVKVKIGNAEINFCTAEDLILLKIISDRPRDLEDAEGVIHFQKETLDYAYLEPRIMELANLLDRPEISERWEKWKKGTS